MIVAAHVYGRQVSLPAGIGKERCHDTVRGKH